MPFVRRKRSLRLKAEDRRTLERLSHSRTESMQRIERARILLGYVDGESISGLAARLGVSRQRVYRCVNKALAVGVVAALEDLPGRGRKPRISDAARAWLLDLACRKPRDLGYAEELWTTRLLAEHCRRHGEQAGHPDLKWIGRGTVSKLLAKAEIKPHKIRYYVEKRDPDFDRGMAQVLCVYQEVALLRERAETDHLLAILSYDEKPGIQAIETTGREKAPVPGQYSTWLRDYEYVRHGTLSLLAGIDLLDGHVHGLVCERHRSAEFIEFLKRVDAYYPPETRIRLILDNHSSHLSRETRAYLNSVPNRFEFIFTPKHASWLNLIETFFAKMAKTVLRGIRVRSKEELRIRLEQYLAQVNESPVIFRWTHGLASAESIS